MLLEIALWVVVVLGGLSLAAMLLALALSGQRLGALIEDVPRGCSLPRSAVDQRVDMMLRDLLAPAEYHTLMTRGYLDVASSQNADAVYRIPRFGGMVTLYEHGRATLDLCVQPADPLPGGDVVVLHKLLIQASEPEYMATARKYPSRFFGDAYHP